MNAMSDMRLVKVWCEQVGITTITAWRWRNEGWLKTTTIGGRLFISDQAIAEFIRRAATREFAREHKVPKPKRKKNMQADLNEKEPGRVPISLEEVTDRINKGGVIYRAHLEAKSMIVTKRAWRSPVRWGPYHLHEDGWMKLYPPEKPMTFWRKVIVWIWLPLWYGSPFEFWGMTGWLWEVPDARYRFTREGGMIRAPFGGIIESIARRRRRCEMCGKWFWREGAFNPLRGVNIFEEQCSKKCAEDSSSLLF
jgi:hypothetical protein